MSAPFLSPTFDHAAYRAFLEAKAPGAHQWGVPVEPGQVHASRKPHQVDAIGWMVRGGRRALFANFGLGKTGIQLEALRLVLRQFGGRGRGLIVAPLGVRAEFLAEAEALGIPLRFIRADDEIDGGGLYLTNYESVREGKITPAGWHAVSLDEAAVLRGFGGTKTFREFMRKWDKVEFRFVATATPSPNEYVELLAYAAFLGVMDVGEAKTRFFQRDSEHADHLTLYPHKEEEFWLWVHSWALFLQRPSDLGHPDDGYELPPLRVVWHCVDADLGAVDTGAERDGQRKLLHDAEVGGLGVVDDARIRRATLGARVAKVAALVEQQPDEHVILWHDLEDERRALEAAVPGLVTVYGAQDLEAREAAIADFAHGRIARLGAKPVMLGSGCNLQRHCARAIFAGVGFRFNDFIQAIHRLYRFLQPAEVTVEIVYARAQEPVRRDLEAKWRRHDEQRARMAELVRRYGLSSVGTHERLQRSIGVARRVARGERFEVVNADCVEETARMAADSVGMILTSIPFGTQYEYTPSYNDFGHTDDDAHFWEQMDFLSPELLRVLKPGRVMAVHVKDRIRPGGMDGLGFQTVSPFHADAILHYRKHGFAFIGQRTIETDVVRENNQTYRLGYSELCKDGSRMGCGMPEYMLLFRKPPTDSGNGYADEPVTRAKADYSVARWQLDAHNLWRSSGNRLLTAADLVGLEADVVYRAFRAMSVATVYDHEAHVAIAEGLAAAKRLPSGFMLIPPASWHPDVVADVARMRTMNTLQANAGREQHLCPLPFDLVEREIRLRTNPGDVVYDPFGGLFTVPYVAVQLGRFGRAAELNAAYFDDGARYLRAAEEKIAAPTLFDLLAAAAGDDQADACDNVAAEVA